MFPNENTLPNFAYVAKRLNKSLGFDYEMILACQMITFYIEKNIKIKLNSHHSVNLDGRLMLILERSIKVY